MMNALSFFVLVAANLIFVNGASIRNAVLRQNAQDAQVLNWEFKALNETDPCNSGRIACIGGALATCKFGSWSLELCNVPEQCFALPSMTTRGTTLTCISESSGLSLMKSLGIDDGLIAKNPNTTVSFPTLSLVSGAASSTATSVPTSSALPTSIPSPSNSNTDPATVTVTQVFSTVLPTEMRTISPAEALSILAHLSSAGYSTPTPSPASPSASPTVPPTYDCEMPPMSSASSAPASSPSISSSYRRSISVSRGLRRAH